MYIISQLFIYPIKSLAGFEVNATQLTDRGPQYDRRWMLVDTNNRFISQREYPEMSLLQTTIENDRLLVYHKNNKEDALTLALEPVCTQNCKVTVWGDDCMACYVSDIADEWFTNKLATPCRLVYMPDSTLRFVEKNYAFNNEITSFADAYPLLMIGQASLDDLNSRLQQPIPINRFRPNIVFTGGQPYDEDLMEQVKVNDIYLSGVKLCSRCPIPTIDQDTALKGKEPLKTLAAYRMRNNKVYFGQNVLHSQTGVFTVGDAIEIIKMKAPGLFNAATI